MLREDLLIIFISAMNNEVENSRLFASTTYFNSNLCQKSRFSFFNNAIVIALTIKMKKKMLRVN